VSLYHFNHGTPLANKMQEAVENFAECFNLPLEIRKTDRKLKTELEFRNARVAFYDEKPMQIVTAHHLGDAVESYFQNFTRGHAWAVPIRPYSTIFQSTVHHPFLLNEKKEFIDYVGRNELGRFVVEDQSNFDPTVGRRNFFRNIILPTLKQQKIGLEKIVLKQYLKWKEGV
jgi:tRNA(Ile)-lysidine synthase TilS/MesJ